MLKEDLVQASKILVAQQVLDAFGHISVRDEGSDELFWMSVAKPPTHVSLESIVSFDMAGDVVSETTEDLYIERFIHSEIYKRRPDVNAICHNHSRVLMPYCISPRRLSAVTQTGAFLGEHVTVWDSSVDFGDTNLLITNREQAASLADALGSDAIILMRGHGCTVVGQSLQELAFKAVYASREAEILSLCSGKPVYRLSAGEVEIGRVPSPRAVSRSWEYWSSQL